MITFTELLESKEREKFAIHTPTKNQAKALLKALDKRGYKWCGGGKLITETLYGIFREDACYNFEPNKEVWYCDLDWYQGNSYTIVEFKDIDFFKKED